MQGTEPKKAGRGIEKLWYGQPINRQKVGLESMSLAVGTRKGRRGKAETSKAKKKKPETKCGRRHDEGGKFFKGTK